MSTQMSVKDMKFLRCVNSNGGIEWRRSDDITRIIPRVSHSDGRCVFIVQFGFGSRFHDEYTMSAGELLFEYDTEAVVKEGGVK